MKNLFKKSIAVFTLAVVVIAGSKTSKGQMTVMSNAAETISTKTSGSFGKNLVQSKIYPNPSAGKMNIAVEDLPAGDIELTLIDKNGNEVYSKVVEHEKEGSFYTNIEADELPNGIYRVKLVHKDFIMVKMWTKL